LTLFFTWFLLFVLECGAIRSKSEAVRFEARAVRARFKASLEAVVISSPGRFEVGVVRVPFRVGVVRVRFQGMPSFRTRTMSE